MKKKFLTFLLAICFILPCGIALTACGQDPDEPSPENAVSVTIDFAMDDDYNFGEYWDIEESTHTYKTTYLNSFEWDTYMFDVVATTANGDSKQLQEVTESNPMGFKVDTNMPDTDGHIPVGTYTYRLYCEDFNNGYYKADACSSEIYTIIVEKETIRLENNEWVYNTNPHTYNGSPISVGFQGGMQAYWGESSVMLEDVGITNFRMVEDDNYTCEAINAGNYTAKVEYEADTINFNYIGELPEKTFNWTIEKANIMNWLDMNSLWSTGDYEYQEWQTWTVEFLEGNLDENLPLTFQGLGGTYSAKEPGTYTCWPIFEQTDTRNYTLVSDYAEQLKHTWKISKGKITLDEYSVYMNNGYLEYTGEPITITPFTTENLIIDHCDNTTQTIPGDYTVRVYLKVADPTHYEISGKDYVDIPWRIAPKIIYVGAPNQGFWHYNETNGIYNEPQNMSEFYSAPEHIQATVVFDGFDAGVLPKNVGTYDYTITCVADEYYRISDPQDPNNEGLTTLTITGFVEIEPGYATEEITITWSYNDGEKCALDAEQDWNKSFYLGTTFSIMAEFDESLLPDNTTVKYIINEDEIDETKIAYGEPLTFDTVGQKVIKVVFESPNIAESSYFDVVDQRFAIIVEEEPVNPYVVADGDEWNEVFTGDYLTNGTVIIHNDNVNNNILDPINTITMMSTENSMYMNVNTTAGNEKQYLVKQGETWYGVTKNADTWYGIELDDASVKGYTFAGGQGTQFVNRFNEFEYDEENHCYVATNFEFAGEEPVDYVKVYIENGKLLTIDIRDTISEDSYYSSYYRFYDYGTTTIEVPAWTPAPQV